MEITVKIDKRSKQAQIVLEMLKTFDFVRFVSGKEQKITPTRKAKSIGEISKEINKAGTKKAFAELGLDYDKETEEAIKEVKATKISLTDFRKQLY